jgi:ribose transport system permease protein
VAISKSATKSSVREFVGRREVGLFLIIVAASAILSLLTPQFLNLNNFISIATGMSYDVIVAIGLTLVLTVGGIDLSVGSILGLTGVVTTMLLRAGVAIPLAVLAGLSLGALLGALNGTFIAKFKINPFIVTLGMMAVARGASVVLTSGYFLSNLPAGYLAIGQGKWFGIPIPIYATIILVIIFDYLLRNWEPLHSIFFIGTNPDAAELSGIKVGKMLIVSYILSGVLAAVAGVFMTSRLAMGYAQFGLGAEQRAIASAVIGGASMSGGEGSIFGTFLGVLLLAIINNGFVLLGLSVYWQGVVNGLILVIAVGVDAIRRMRRGEDRD